MLAAKAAWRLVLLSGGVGSLLLGVLLAYRSGSSLWPSVLVVAVPVVAVGWVVSARAAADWSRARAGVDAEERVARSLVRSGAACVVHGVLLGRGDVDHVVLGPWLVAVETKFGRGEVRVDARGRLTVGGKVLPRDPVGQAKEGARRLSWQLGRDVKALLVVSDGSGAAFAVDGVVVSPLKGLDAVLRSFPAFLDEGTACALGEHLPRSAP